MKAAVRLWEIPLNCAKGFNKAVGIAAVIRLFDIPWENTVAFWRQQQ